MAKVTGVVEKISQRGNAFNICVDGNWYGFGFTEPDFKEGVTVEFDVAMRGRYANVDNDTFKVVKKASASKKGGTAGGYNSYDDRQRSINWQSARNAAIAIATTAVEAGVVALPAAKAKKLDAVLALVDELTGRYYYDTELVATGRAEEVVEANVNVDEGDELDQDE